MLKRKVINLVLLSIIPIFVAFLVHIIWDVPISLLSGIFYIILFLFNLPSGSFMSTNTDYNIKRVNPHYKAEKQEVTSLSNQPLITLAILIVLTIVSFLVYVQQIQN
ncbi:hypothetical protein CAR_c22190 [Carnobacterium sp. 17-4]|nr:hypothetical protein CAR_c22190 [Carnobacterium sp. 17-4]